MVSLSVAHSMSCMWQMVNHISKLHNVVPRDWRVIRVTATRSEYDVNYIQKVTNFNLFLHWPSLKIPTKRVISKKEYYEKFNLPISLNLTYQARQNVAETKDQTIIRWEWRKYL